MENSKNQRVKEVFDHLKRSGEVYNQSDFVKKLSQNKSFVSEILNSKREVNEHFVRQICDKFPEINGIWILTGEEEMLRTPPPPTKIMNRAEPPQTIPLHVLLARLDKKDEQIDKLIETIISQAETIASQQRTIEEKI